MGPYCGTKHSSKVWLNTEPCGFICGSLTWSFLLFGNFVYNTEIVIKWVGLDNILGMLNFCIFNFFSCMALFCHLKAMFTDPGAVPKDALPIECDEGEKDYEADVNGPPFKKWCGRCKAFKPRRSHHCSICGRCIIKMDHHCPWINNCVGLSNHRYFLLFVSYIFLTCIYSLVILVMWYFMCTTTVETKSFSHESLDPSSPVITKYDMKEVKCSDLSNLPILALFESILFGLFTFCLLGDQYFLIVNNINPIERLKEKKRKEKTTEEKKKIEEGLSYETAQKDSEFDELIGLTSSTITSSSISGNNSSPVNSATNTTINIQTLKAFKLVKKIMSNISYIEKNYIKSSSYSIDNFSGLTISYEEYLNHLNSLIDIRGPDRSNDANFITTLSNTNEIILLKLLNFNEIFFCYKKKKNYLYWMFPFNDPIKNKKLKEIVYGYRLESETYNELNQEEDDENNEKKGISEKNTIQSDSEKTMAEDFSPLISLNLDESGKESNSISSVSTVCGPPPSGFSNDEIILPANKYNRTLLDDSPIMFDSLKNLSRRERSSSCNSSSSNSISSLLDKKDSSSMRKRI